MERVRVRERSTASVRTVAAQMNSVTFSIKSILSILFFFIIIKSNMLMCMYK